MQEETLVWNSPFGGFWGGGLQLGAAPLAKPEPRAGPPCVDAGQGSAGAKSLEKQTSVNLACLQVAALLARMEAAGLGFDPWLLIEAGAVRTSIHAGLLARCTDAFGCQECAARQWSSLNLHCALTCKRLQC